MAKVANASSKTQAFSSHVLHQLGFVIWVFLHHNLGKVRVDLINSLAEGPGVHIIVSTAKIGGSA